jgi:hypothetical protein
MLGLTNLTLTIAKKKSRKRNTHTPWPSKAFLEYSPFHAARRKRIAKGARARSIGRRRSPQYQESREKTRRDAGNETG